ncbi:MAG TPA: hypothetical protein VGO00_28880 [Kofleriaceae bacterium]|nr:hypothetical protein [Kofleriaceae bacterium]
MHDDLAPRPHHTQRGAGIGVLLGIIAALISSRSVFDGALFGVVAGTFGGTVYGWLRRP